MADQIRVLPDDIERDVHTGKHSDYRYRRFHIRSIDAWGPCENKFGKEYSSPEGVYYSAEEAKRAALRNTGEWAVERIDDRKAYVEIVEAGVEIRWVIFERSLK